MELAVVDFDAVVQVQLGAGEGEVGQLFVVVAAFLELLEELLLAFGRSGDFAAVGAVVDHVLHSVDLALVDTLQAVQIVYTQGSDGVRRITVEVDQGLEAVLLAAVEEPVDGPLAGAGDGIGLAVVVEEVVQEIIPDDLAAGAALVAQGLGDEVQVVLQGIRTVDGANKLDKAGDDIVLQVGFVGDGDHVVLVRTEVGVPGIVPLAAGIGKSVPARRVAAKHAAHGIGDQRANISPQVRPAHGDVLVLHLWS